MFQSEKLWIQLQGWVTGRQAELTGVVSSGVASIAVGFEVRHLSHCHRDGLDIEQQ